MFKSFDQICRPLLFSLLALAGLPPRILGPYAKHMQALEVRPQYARTVGEAYVRPAAIPQGCPWSMTFIGVLMEPWIRLTLSQHPMSLPRVLADDLLLATG
eukprot:14349235-Alexandrium_andersonii.AAC.1